MQICFVFFVTLVTISFSGPAPLIPVGLESLHKNTSLIQGAGDPPPGTQCSTVKRCDIAGTIKTVLGVNLVISKTCKETITENEKKKKIHTARIKAVQEFQEHVGDNFCGSAEIVKWLTEQSTTWTSHVTTTEKDCSVYDGDNKTLTDIQEDLDYEKEKCLTTTTVQQIEKTIQTLVTSNEVKKTECVKEVTVLKKEKIEYSEEIGALKEFKLYVGDEWCGETVLQEFITEKESTWTISQKKIDDNCKTFTDKETELETIITTITSITAGTTTSTCVDA